jgi:hypothetical protein
MDGNETPIVSAKSNHARSVQYRARKQAVDLSVNRLLTRVVLYQCPNVVWPDLIEDHEIMSDGDLRLDGFVGQRSVDHVIE